MGVFQALDLTDGSLCISELIKSWLLITMVHLKI